MNEMKRILIIYYSGTGNTKRMAELLRQGCRKVKGVVVDVEPAISVDIRQAAKYDGYGLGSPDYFSYVAGELKMFFDRILRNEAFHGKPFAAFGSHGGGGKVVGVIEQLAKACKLERAAEGVLCKGAPDEPECQATLHALGEALALAVKARP